MFSSVSSSLLFITLISTTLLSTLVHSQSSAIGPIPLIGNNSLANPAWTTLFLTGVTIPQIPLKSTTFLSNLLVDANNCGPFSNKWAFGIDDGPSEFSLRHNQYLKANSIPATYFMIGRQIPPLAAYVKSVADDPSFIVAGHTYSHSYLFSLTNENIVGELVWGAKAIYDATGRVPR